MNEFTIKALQDELAETEEAIEHTNEMVDEYRESLEEQITKQSRLVKTRRALRRLLRENDAPYSATEGSSA